MGSGFTLKMRLKGRVKHIDSGVVSITKSDGVTGMLYKQGAGYAARCNSLASLPHGHPEYDVQVKPLSWCNGVRVGVANADAYIDNLRNNTLKKGCGI